MGRRQSESSDAQPQTGESNQVFGASIRNRLGTGEFGTPEDAADTARGMFLREIQASAPIVLTSLKETVWPDFGKASDSRLAALGSRTLRALIYQWAKRLCLLQNNRVPSWLISQVHATLATWADHPSQCPSSWGGIYTGYSTRISGGFTITFPEFYWDPRRGFESREHFEDRVVQEIRKILRERLNAIEDLLAKRLGLTRSPEFRRPQHFNWAVRYQVLGERVTDIADSVRAGDIDDRTINSGIKNVLSLVGLSRRAAKPGPRPKRT